jgi:NAD(P) transhydrogenase subunit alpha
MLMTAAGTVKAARVVILGVGVAGLQAIATAKRLGAVIEASDVRPSVKEQVESLGGKFIDVPYETDEEREAAVGVGGYAKPMPPSWLERQKAEVAKRVAQADVVITTALIPGRAAPVLVTEDMVKAMKPGSVIVDLAAPQGGNCPLTEARQDRGQARRDADRRDQCAGPRRGRCQRALCTQPARLPQAHHHQRRHAQ